MKMGKHVVMVCGAMACFGSANAALVVQDSSTFDFKYEMDVVSSTQDLDANTVSDWFGGVAGGLTIPQVSGGIAGSDLGAGEQLWRSDIGGSISRAAILGDYTIEFSVFVNSDGNGGAGTAGYFGVVLDHVNDTPSLRLNIDANEVNFNFDGADPIATADNTDGFHTFRIAYDTSNGSDDYYVWRDGVLLGGPIAPTNGSANGSGVFFLGNFSGSLGGNWQVDYIRIDKDGAFAPVPEPGSLVLLALGGLTLARRRRD
ncbi:MAG: PEP-CTERM sorting domain-containing protein [Phycisphaeraceae bacterium]